MNCMMPKDIYSSCEKGFHFFTRQMILLLYIPTQPRCAYVLSLFSSFTQHESCYEAHYHKRSMFCNIDGLFLLYVCVYMLYLAIHTFLCWVVGLTDVGGGGGLLHCSFFDSPCSVICPPFFMDFSFFFFWCSSCDKYWVGLSYQYS